ncbi:MAG: DNA polymerase III subunit alpha, partial [Candidatus Babeliales bacterium]
IAKRCNLQLKLNEFFLPNFPTPQNISVDDYLRSEAIKGLENRLKDSIEKINEENRKIYVDRLNLELDMIIKMGFSGYFLIVADFIAWAKANGVPVGPGRGSGAGSLVAYALKITGLDPLTYDLLFERFLNPERVSLPDFDVDFCMDGRDRVIEYVVNTYGAESVAQIITFGTMAAKAVVRDVGRVLALPYGFVDKIAKLIPFELGITLKKALEQEPLLQQRYDSEDEVKTLIDLAKKLEGIARNAGKHAGGVVIAPSKISEFTALYLENPGDQAVTQLDKDDIETIGLVKFDFLGLRTLTIINWATETINKDKRENLIDIETIPLDDVKTFDLLKSCSTTGVFQLESRGMKDLIKRLQPDCFEDIIALVALFRPGPLQSGMVDDFISRKHGNSKIEYLHPDLEPILRATYGVILYQEQVMQIAQTLAGYTLGGADLLRRAMGKKKPEEMAKQRAIFIKGAEERGISRSISQAIFDLMEKFAGYGFNKSHSAAYAMVSYQTAWLKANYPAAFMAAVLSSDMDNTDKVSNFVSECRNMKLEILAPNINSSEYKFTVTQNGEILYGLGAIKGLGEAAIENIILERKKKTSFNSFFNFCNCIDLRKTNRRALEALIKSGSLDIFGQERSVLFNSIEAATRLAEAEAHNQASGQHDLFSNVSKQEQIIEYAIAKPWSAEERLNYEKETLGLYLSGNPLDQFINELRQFVTAPLEQLALNKNQTIFVAGIITQVRTMFTKRGDKMAFITIEDQKGRLELAIFSDIYDKYRDLIQKDQLIVTEVEVTIIDGGEAYKANAKNIMTLEKMREASAKYIQIKFHSENTNHLSKVVECLTPFKHGKLPLIFLYENDNTKVNIETNRTWRVSPSNKLIAELTSLLGAENVEVLYS